MKPNCLHIGSVWARFLLFANIHRAFIWSKWSLCPSKYFIISRVENNSENMEYLKCCKSFVKFIGVISLLLSTHSSLHYGTSLILPSHPTICAESGRYSMYCIWSTRACSKTASPPGMSWTASRPGHVVKLRSDQGMSSNCVPNRACRKLCSDQGMSSNCVPTSACRKTASRPVHVVKLHPDQSMS